MKIRSENEDDWTPYRIHSIQQKNNSLGFKSKKGPPFYTKTLLVINRPIKLIVDTILPVTLIPKTKATIQQSSNRHEKITET